MAKYDWLEDYLMSKPGATKDYKVEWEWWRYQVGGKLFAAIMHPSAKYAPEYAEKDLISLKCDPLFAEVLRAEHAEVLPGFYTDKRSWNSINLQGDLPEELLKKLIDDSYKLVFEKLTKKAQKEILEQV